MSLRINIISKKSLRRKLCAYFEYMQDKTGSSGFELELSLSALANYLCSDRSSMMRELKNMADEGLIQRKNKFIKILY